jgi:hypothetical protein
MAAQGVLWIFINQYNRLYCAKALAGLGELGDQISAVRPNEISGLATVGVEVGAKMSATGEGAPGLSD